MIQLERIKKRRSFSVFISGFKSAVKWSFATLPRRIISSILIVLFIISPLSFLLFKNKVEAAWWNDSWAYRKKIEIANSSGSELTDFQVKVLINQDLSTDISDGKIQSDLDDLRFTDQNGKIIPYWIEDATTSSVDIWVKIPSIPTSGATIYIYYGNPTASSYSNGESTFLFFDDFSGSALDTNKWEVVGTPITNTVSGGILDFRTDAGAEYIKTRSYTATSGIAIRTKQKDSNSYSYPGEFSFGIRGVAGGAAGKFAYTNAQYCLLVNDGSSETYTSGIATDDDWHVWDTTWLSNESKLFQDGTQKGNTLTSNLPTGSLPLEVGAIDGWGAVTTFTNMDWILVRKTASTEPSAGSLGSEEKGTGPVAYWKFDEGYGTTVQDGTVNNSDGTISGATWQNEEKCVSGKCLYFNGSSDYVNFGNPDSINFQDQAMTMSAWIKPQALGTGDIFNKTVDSTDWNGYSIFYNSEGKVTFYLLKTLGTVQGVLTSSSTIPLNQWSHIEAVYTGSQMHIYINGKLDASTDYSGGYDKVSGYSAVMGKHFNSSGNYFKGYIDEFKIYGYARSVSQATLDYNFGLSGSTEGSEASFGGKSQKWMSDGLVGYWKMDESSWGSVVDSSGNGNNGTAYNGATIDAGKFGNGGSFDGNDDYVQTSGAPSLTGQNQMSVGAWIYDIGFSDESIHFIVNGQDNNFQFWWNAGNGLCLQVRTSAWNGCTGGVAPSTGQWVYVFSTYDGKNIKNYINGQLMNTIEQNGEISTNTPIGAFTIGNYNSPSSSYAFRGRIDDLRVYNRALSPQEVSDLYNYAPGPVGYWKMDEKSGSYAYDTSGNGNTGTLTNSPTWNNGKIGGGIKFDGSDDYIEKTSFSGIDNTTNSHTWEAWIKTGSDVSTYRVFLALGAGGDTINTGDVRVQGNNIDAYWHGSSHVFGGILGTTTLATDTWYHVAVIFADGSYPILYINGISEGSTTGTAQSFAGSSWKFRAGSTLYSDGAATYNGSIDDIKIYNYARTADQIKEDMLGRSGSSVSEKSTLGYWKFDEGSSSTAYDSSGQGYNGTITGATWTNNGKFGKVLTFANTDDKVQMSSPMITGTGDFTFSAWIKRAATGSVDSIISNYGLDPCTGGVEYYVYNDHVGIYIGSSVNGSATISANTWYHVAATRNNGSVTLYINGSVDATGTLAGSIGNGCNLAIGNGPNYTSEKFEGQIDEVKVYNYALTADEIKLDMNRGKSVSLTAKGTDASGNPSNSEDRKYCPPGDTTATCGPAGEWKFDEGTSTTANDTSGNGNYGTLTNGPIWTSGKYGSGIKFDGSNDYVSVSDSDSFSFVGNSFTVEVWVKPSVNPDDYDVVVGKWNNQASATKEWLFRPGTSNTWEFRLIDSSNVSIGRVTTDTIPVSQWTHVTGVYDGSTTSAGVSIYVNGVRKDTTNIGTSYAGMSNTTAKLFIGALEDTVSGNSNYYNGVIDDVKIYDYARSASEIAWDYNRGKPITEYRFNECQGSIVHDESGNGNNGTIIIGGSGTQDGIGTCTDGDTTNSWYNGRTGKYSASLNFDGTDDYVDLPSSLPDTPSQLAVSFWINPDSWSTDGGGWILDSGEMDVVIGTHINDDYMYFNRENANHSTFLPPTTGSWTHVVAVWPTTASNATVYYNGILQSATATSNYGTIGAGDVIGQRVGGSYNFDGKIDDIKIYNYALTAQQVKDVYNGGAINFK